MYLKILFILFFIPLFARNAGCQISPEAPAEPAVPQVRPKIIPAAEQPEAYLPLLRDKRVGVVVNQTAKVGDIHLLDHLISENIQVAAIFAPEHGFRGDASAGEKISDGKDLKTGISVISLYGKVHKPTSEHLKDLDVLVFDIQDVGCRFYTYLSTLFYCVEACAENGLPLVVLDRPNPNGDYVGGPILQPEFNSFVGVVPVPVVHGCTLGEMALMINGQGWHKAPSKADITVVEVKNYSHRDLYKLPVPPSPNLPNHQSVRLYPSLCFFEATSASIGRGTEFPFQVIGGTLPSLGDFSFTPANMPGVAVNPVNMNKSCYGVDLRSVDPVPPFTLKYFLDFYNNYPAPEQFLTNERWFNLLAGNDDLLRDIRAGKSEDEIADSWRAGLDAYKSIRRNYLLYPDFE